MQKGSLIKQLAVVFIATLLAVACLLELGVIERVSYAIERGRLRALGESLSAAEDSPQSAAAGRVAGAGRAVARLVAPAVVAIETEFAEIVAKADEESAGDQPAAQEPGLESGGRGDQSSESSSSTGAAVAVRQGFGSGFIFDAEHGYALTNAHVVEGARSVRVSLADGRRTEAVVLGADAESDLAVLRIELPRLHALPLGGGEPAEVGDDVLAVGNPFGLEGTVSKGIISAVNRRNVAVNAVEYASFIQTDAAITPGYSGGPLVNMGGEVIGVNTAIATNTGRFDGVGFAIPLAGTGKLIGNLIEGGPGSLGVWVGSVADPDWRPEVRALDFAESYGALVTEVIAGTAAEKAGLEANDIILAIDGRRVEDIDRLGAILSKHGPGSTVQVRLFRSGKQMTLPVRLDRRYAPR